ncbi:MAG TPA: hypothetical protein VF755_11260, partial [Catenuloplanes sp.]
MPRSKPVVPRRSDQDGLPATGSRRTAADGGHRTAGARRRRITVRGPPSPVGSQGRHRAWPAG